MLTRSLSAALVLACLGLAAPAASAQQVIHALTGTVSHLDPAGKTISVLVDGASQADFADATMSSASVSMDKKVRALIAAGSDGHKAGAYVIVFFYGGNDARTAVGLRSLGTGPFSSTVGTVVKFEGHLHSLTVTDEAGQTQTFKVDENTVTEGGFGVVDGSKFQARKGDRVRIVASGPAGDLAALFIRGA